MVGGRAGPQRVDTCWSSPLCHTEALLAMPALPQRTRVWKRGHSSAHTLWKERRQVSENNLLWAHHHKNSHWLSLLLFLIRVYHVPSRQPDWEWAECGSGPHPSGRSLLHNVVQMNIYWFWDLEQKKHFKWCSVHVCVILFQNHHCGSILTVRHNFKGTLVA